MCRGWLAIGDRHGDGGVQHATIHPQAEGLGFSTEQAEGLADALADDVVTELATKTHLREMGDKLTIRLGGCMAVMLSLAVAAIKLL